MSWEVDIPEGEGPYRSKAPVREVPMTDEPCPSCLRAAFQGVIRREAVQPLPAGAFAPIDMEGEKWCFDCASASGLMRVSPALTWDMARTAVGNDRQEQYRLPGVEMGLVMMKLAKPSKPGDFEKHLEWLDRVLPLEDDDHE